MVGSCSVAGSSSSVGSGGTTAMTAMEAAKLRANEDNEARRCVQFACPCSAITDSLLVMFTRNVLLL